MAKCDKCGISIKLEDNLIEVDFTEYSLQNMPTIETTVLCGVCYSSFLFYFDKFMEEK